MSDQSLLALHNAIRTFAIERDWEQFHNPKNLVMALTGEVGELNEIFQWLTPDEAASVMESKAGASAVEEEVADVLIYLMRLADVLEIDLIQVANDKLALNAEKYPADTSRGLATRPAMPR